MLSYGQRLLRDARECQKVLQVKRLKGKSQAGVGAAL